MPGKKMASIKNPRQYEALKKEGYDKTSAARITNASAAKSRKSKRGVRA